MHFNVIYPQMRHTLKWDSASPWNATQVQNINEFS